MSDAATAIAEGWKDISTALRVSVKTAQRMALRNIDPLPVRHGHRGPWAFVEALRAWVHRQDMAYAAHIALERVRRTGVGVAACPDVTRDDASDAEVA